MTPEKIPVATYRVQFNKDFRFLDCRDIVPYLHTFGIGALYSSPRFRARRGSEHGYDVASPLRVNSELGTDEEFDDLCMQLRHYGLGLILDIVPNHMAASHETPWWIDVLEHGPSSPYAHYFDIEWHPVVSKSAFLQEGKILLPVLGDLYGNVLARGELTLDIEETGFFVRYYDRKLPLDPATWEPILEAWLLRIQRDARKKREPKAVIEQVRRLVRDIPPRSVSNPEERSRRIRDAFTAQERRHITGVDTVVRSLAEADVPSPAPHTDYQAFLAALNGWYGFVGEDLPGFVQGLTAWDELDETRRGAADRKGQCQCENPGQQAAAVQRVLRGHVAFLCFPRRANK